MSKYLVFDFDGVIINSHDLQKKALLESYKEVVGKGEPPYNEFFKNSGDSLGNIFSKLNLPMEMLPLYTSISKCNLDMITMHDGIRQMLKEFTAKGYKLALCTGKERKRTLDILKYLNIQRFFKAIVCSDDVKNPKPSPDSLIKCIDDLKGKLEKAVMIGDSVNDIICAKNAGVYSIGVTWGDLERHAIVHAMPDAVADNVNELIKTIEEIGDRYGEN